MVGKHVSLFPDGNSLGKQNHKHALTSTETLRETRETLATGKWETQAHP